MCNLAPVTQTRSSAALYTGFGSVDYFPVCRLFALFLGVTAETVVGGFRIEAQNLPFFMDAEGESRNRGPDEVPEERERRRGYQLTLADREDYTCYTNVVKPIMRQFNSSDLHL